MPRLTRRQTTAMIVAASVNPGLAFGQSKRVRSDQDFAEMLASILNDALRPGYSGRFSVLAFDNGKQNDASVMEAVVRMDWPPGYRRRVFSGMGSTEERAFSVLLEACRDAFGDTWPGCLT